MEKAYRRREGELAVIGDAPLSKYTGVPGWESTAEEEALIQLAREYMPDRGGVLVEIGVEYGRSTAEFAFACKDKPNTRIVSVDLFPDNHHIAGQHGGLLAVWRQNLIEAGVQNYDNVTLEPIQGNSAAVGQYVWNNTPIDLLFIDGDHSYEGVRKDIANWWGYLKPGGIIIFHDYSKGDDSHYLHKEVKRAVDEIFNHPGIREGYWKRIELPDSLIAFAKHIEAGKTYWKSDHDTADDAQTPVASSPSAPEKPKTRKVRKAK